MTTRELTIERVRELLSYDAESGVLTWKVTRCNNLAREGRRAGRTLSSGHRDVCVERRRYQEHRLVWFIVNGVWPNGIIDHINGQAGDNRVQNLRLVTMTENRQNQRNASKNSRTGLLGVVPRGLKFGASIQANGKRYDLGQFQTPEAAHDAYVKAKRKLHSTCTI